MSPGVYMEYNPGPWAPGEWCFDSDSLGELARLLWRVYDDTEGQGRHELAELADRIRERLDGEG